MWLTALVLGLAGSLHCAGMCSPLAMAVNNLRRPFVINKLVYNSGRILSYGMLGAIVATVGQLFRFSEFQNVLSVVLGSVLILLGIGGISGFRIPLITPAIQKFTSWLKILFGKFLQRKTYAAIGFLGILNGLLPCGLTYLALSYCLIVQGPLDGFNFMLLFGVGTLPVMFGLTWVIQYAVRKFNFNFSRVTTIMFIFLGFLLIGRVLMQHQPQDMKTLEGKVSAEVVCK